MNLRNEHLRQSATTGYIVIMRDVHTYTAQIKSAMLGTTTVSITAEFPHLTNARAFVQSFGLSEWQETDLTDYTSHTVRDPD